MRRLFCGPQPYHLHGRVPGRLGLCVGGRGDGVGSGVGEGSVIEAFVRQEEASGVELAIGSDLERALALLVTARWSQNRKLGSRSSGRDR